VINLGGTIDYFVKNSFNYPTLAEGYKIAALDLWNRLQIDADCDGANSSESDDSNECDESDDRAAA